VTIKDRIRAIATECGGPSALARLAGLTPSTVAQYLSDQKGRASEPGATALAKLARAANVSIEWLATGQGSKDRSLLPAGFVEIPSFDLRENIYGLLQNSEITRDGIIVRATIIERIGAPLASLSAALIGDGNPPSVNDDDTIIFEATALGHGRRVPAIVHDGRHYLIAQGVRAMVRQLHRRDEKLIAFKDRDGKTQNIDPASPEFRILGRVHWRGGVV
jgi:phage repressor protein C with HTH and peptisase S24 domain